MKITICTSMAFVDEMLDVKKKLEELGHEVKVPPEKFVDDRGKEWDARDYYKFKKSQPFEDPVFLNNHTNRIRLHFDKVEWCDAILVTNFDKNGIDGYIGPNSLMEMGVAFYLKKKIFLLNPIPDLAWKEEIIGMKPVVIDRDLTKVI